MSTDWEEHKNALRKLGLWEPTAKPNAKNAVRWCDQVKALSSEKYSCARQTLLAELFDQRERAAQGNIPTPDKTTVYLHHTAGYAPKKWDSETAANVKQNVKKMKALYMSDNNNAEWNEFAARQEAYLQNLTPTDKDLINFYGGNGFKPMSYYLGKWFGQPQSMRQTFDANQFVNLLPRVGDRSMSARALRPALRVALDYTMSERASDSKSNQSLWFSSKLIDERVRATIAKRLQPYLIFAAKGEPTLQRKLNEVPDTDVVAVFEMMFVALLGRLQQVVLAAPPLPFTALAFRGAPKPYRSPSSSDGRCLHVTSTLMSTSFYPQIAPLFFGEKESNYMMRVALPKGLPLLFIVWESEALLPRNLCLAALTRERARTIFDTHNRDELVDVKQTDFAVIDGPSPLARLPPISSFTMRQAIQILLNDANDAQTAIASAAPEPEQRLTWWQWLTGSL